MINDYSALRVICVFSLLLKYAWNVKFVKYSPTPRTQMPFSVARAFSCNCITWNRYHPQLPGIVENIEWSGRYRKRERWKRGGDGGGGAIGDSLHTNNCVCMCERCNASWYDKVLYIDFTVNTKRDSIFNAHILNVERVQWESAILKAHAIRVQYFQETHIFHGAVFF